MKSVKTVLLEQELAVFVPLTPQFLSAAHVSDGADKTAVEQADTLAVEGRPGTDPVGTVSVEQQGVLTAIE